MSKGTNTFLFILGATIFNLVVIVVLLILAVVIVAVLKLPPILILVGFLGSIAGSFLLYSWLVHRLSRRIDMDKYFLPLFRPKRKP